MWPMRVGAFAAVLLSLGLAACGRSGAAGLPGGSAAGPGLGFPVERAAQAATDYVLDGIQAEQRSSDATEDGAALRLEPAGAGAAYCVFRFNPPSAGQQVTLDLDPAGTTGAYIGLANFATQRWDFSGPHKHPKGFAIDPAKHVSQLGNVYIAVLAPAGQTARIEACRLKAENLPPVAAFSMSASGGVPPLQIEFDASASSDGDGAIALYEWDFDGDGVYDEQSAGPTTSHLYRERKGYAPGLRVSDGAGGSASFAHSLDCSVRDVELLGEDAGGVQIALVDGNPAVAYADATGLVYRRALDAEGAEWGDPVLIDANGYAGDLELAVVGGRPAVCYHAPGLPREVLYARAADATGATWGSPVAASPGTNLYVLAGLSLAEVNGRPAIALCRQFPGVPEWELWFVRASDADGNAWPAAPQFLYGDGYTGQYCSLAVVDGRPAISFVDDSPDYHLCYVRASDADGASWPAPVVADSAKIQGSQTSLAIVDGRPAIAYMEDWRSLRYVRALDAQGAGWETALTLEAGNPSQSLQTGWDASLLVADGIPTICYLRTYQVGVQPVCDLCCVKALDAAGAQWDAPFTLDDVSNFAPDTVALASGAPAAVHAHIEPPGSTRFKTRF